ncbi:alpha/beta fold hydrolase [Pseudonocardia acaciae]|uniref:alpha/beta fold hydrolase n=1 Tax=Pseudonocardia acaciae TaxID=551276 RepID=UPI00048C87A6|nr:alpha/beta hydrolase [Pseudonocardia acaciae]
MATFVLVPGGWHGGWYFGPLADRLRERGHRAHPVTLTGIGERNHLAGANLDTHVRDVLGLLDSERIEDAVLCGHSYAGMVISGVADRAPGRVRALVYSDAYVPEDGQSCWELTTDGFRQLFLEGARADGHTIAAPPGLDPRTTSHPLASMTQVARLTGAWRTVARKHYVYLSGWPGSPFPEVYRRLRADPGWSTHELPVSHNVMRDAPDALLDILLRAADA